MVRNGTYEEFVRWREYLTSLLPSNSVDAPRYALPRNARARLTVKRTGMQKPPTATNETNGNQARVEQSFVHSICSGLEPPEQESQLWED
jgi:hypothetical protein